MGWFWLRVSYEISFNIQPGLQSFEDLTKAKWLTWLFVRGLSSFTYGPLIMI